MYLMTAKSSVRGRSYEYVRLCESVWKNGRSTRRIVATLGRKDQLEPHLERLFELCRGHKPDAAEPAPLRSFRYGPFLALRCLWQELGLPQLLGPLSDRVLVLVANRLTAPGSEHALAAGCAATSPAIRKAAGSRPPTAPTPNARLPRTPACACRPSSCSAGTAPSTPCCRSSSGSKSISSSASGICSHPTATWSSTISRAPISKAWGPLRWAVRATPGTIARTLRRCWSGWPWWTGCRCRTRCSRATARTPPRCRR